MAVQANELRIDNWVQVTDKYLKRIVSGKINKYQQVENLWSFGINISSGYEGSMEAEFDMEHIEGIPLTPDIIFEMGFAGKYKSVGYSFTKDGVNLSSQDVDDEGGEIKDYVFHVYFEYRFQPVFFVHQLQNLYFSLTQKELTYTP